MSVAEISGACTAFLEPSIKQDFDPFIVFYDFFLSIKEMKVATLRGFN